MIRALDKNNDWTLGNLFLSGRAGVMQDCETRLREWREDCFFNRAAGVDYAACFDTGDNRSLALQQISVCNRTEDVMNVDSYNQYFDNDTRVLKSEIIISTVYGEGVLHA